jgi:hypothetical protein
LEGRLYYYKLLTFSYPARIMRPAPSTKRSRKKKLGSHHPAPPAYGYPRPPLRLLEERKSVRLAKRINETATVAIVLGPRKSGSWPVRRNVDSSVCQPLESRPDVL